MASVMPRARTRGAARRGDRADERQGVAGAWAPGVARRAAGAVMRAPVRAMLVVVGNIGLQDSLEVPARGFQPMPADPGKREARHVQDILEMELGGLEPPTSWVRSKLARGDPGVRRCELAGNLCSA